MRTHFLTLKKAGRGQHRVINGVESGSVVSGGQWPHYGHVLVFVRCSNDGVLGSSHVTTVTPANAQDRSAATGFYAEPLPTIENLFKIARE